MTTLTEQLWRLRLALRRTGAPRMAELTARPWLQLRVLRAVAEQQARTQADVAEVLMVDAAVVCRLVDKLEADGLLLRLEGDDRRCVRLEATPAARPHVELLSNQLEWLEHRACEPLTAAEAKTLHRLLQKVEDGLTASASSAPGSGSPRTCKRAEGRVAAAGKSAAGRARGKPARQSGAQRARRAPGRRAPN